MNWKFIVSSGMFLVLAALVGADFISTTITTDGTSMLATSGSTENGSYASRIMTSELSEVSRSLSGGENLESEVSVKSSGPILISDYASGKSAQVPEKFSCVFSSQLLKNSQDSELFTLGILNKGVYAASRVAGSGLTGGTEVNGSGMMSFGSQVIGNDTMRSSGFVSGNMTIRDFVRYGGRV